MLVALLAYKHCVSSGVSGFADVLAVANHLQGRETFVTRVYSNKGESVQPFSGLPLAVDGSFAELLTKGADIAYIPPAWGGGVPPSSLSSAAGTLSRKGTVLCAACAGVFALAESGILDGRPATTHWGLVDTFASRYPQVDLKPQRMIVDNGETICAGGITAFHDLALHIVSRFCSAELAATCARSLLLDPGRAKQTPYMSLLQTTPHADEVILEGQQWLEQNHPNPVSIAKLAEKLNLTERTLLRRFKKATGQSPASYLKAIRVEHAKRLLETTDMAIDEIVHTIGYNDGPAFFRLFKTMTGLTPGEYRARFGMPTA